jgi:hypothetical protein
VITREQVGRLWRLPRAQSHTEGHTPGGKEGSKLRRWLHPDLSGDSGVEWGVIVSSCAQGLVREGVSPRNLWRYLV